LRIERWATRGQFDQKSTDEENGDSRNHEHGREAEIENALEGQVASKLRMLIQMDKVSVFKRRQREQEIGFR
jgi:hypothetical protein